MKNKVPIDCLHTGVPGLDDVLGGGLPEFSFNLIAGPPGSGKTTLAHQIMFALATPERPALYFTVLGEPPLKMLRYQQQFDFFDGQAINRSLRFINLSEETVQGGLEQVRQRIVAEVKTHSPALVFIDSFRSLNLVGNSEYGGDADFQQFVQQLGVLMTSWKATTFLIGEYIDDSSSNPVFTIADGLIWLRQTVQRNSVVRKLEIVKMRGRATVPGLHTFRIGDAGIVVFAPALGLAQRGGAAAAVTETRLSMGIARLDDMLGGGMPSGYSLLVAGPSGSGKSILAAAFLAEGVRVGQAGVFAAFERNPRRTLNGRIASLIDSGRIGVIENHASDLSIDEILSLLLVSALAVVGVTVIMTCELEDRYNDLRFSPYGTAFMTDSIIVQRYIEVGSRLRRLIAVVKVRDSAHSHELREFTIDESGIVIGDMLQNQEGLLGGQPSKKRTTDLIGLEIGTESA